MKTETLRCLTCDRDFTRERKRGVKPLRCPGCRKPSKPTSGSKRNNAAGPIPPGERLAGNLTKYRLAIEIALPAIKLGKYDEAIKTLEEATR